MGSTAKALHDSDGVTSGKNPPFLSREEMVELLSRLDVPFYLQRTFLVWWRVCTAPFGREIRFMKSIPDLARAARVCERTARYHVRKFERLELIAIAKTSQGKLLKQNTERRPVTYQLRTETLMRNRWELCPHCGHKHAKPDECGCEMGERRGRFHTKTGVVSKPIRRTCRCKPLHPAPTPIRPQRSSHASPQSSPLPAQEPSRSLEAPAPVRETPPEKKPLVAGLTARRQEKLARMVASLKGRSLPPPKNKAELIQESSYRAVEEAKRAIRRQLGESDPWERMLERLKHRVNRHSYDTWLQPTRYDHESDGILFVRVPTKDFFIVGDKYVMLIEEAIQELRLPYTGVQFVAPDIPDDAVDAVSDSEALQEACKQLGISLEAGREHLLRCGWTFDDPGE